MEKRLEDFSIIKCAEGEEILCVQRQHLIVLVVPMVLQVIIATCILFLLSFIIQSFSTQIPFNNLSSLTLIAYITLTIISTLLLTEIFTFMSWYYQFYIITNKAIIHRNSFRIVGFYSEALMLNQMHEQRIERDSTNLIYDFLKIQDVYVYFHKLEREEPFVFKTPDDAQAIEDLLQDLIVKSNNTQKITQNEPS